MCEAALGKKADVSFCDGSGASALHKVCVCSFWSCGDVMVVVWWKAASRGDLSLIHI